MIANNRDITVSEGLAIERDEYSAYHVSIKGSCGKQTVLQNIKQLQQQLRQQNSHKRDQFTTAIWIHLVYPYLKYADELYELGFNIHNAANNQITLYKWIHSIPDLVPAFTLFYIGCGAVLIKDSCILLVQQKLGPKKGKYGIPGGRADRGENIINCIQRQLFQQTHIKAKFKGILQFRETSQSIYDCVDCYFVCLMSYEPDAFDSMQICELQLSDYKWVPLCQYLDFQKKHNATRTQTFIAEYITKLWANGFDFEKSKLPKSTFHSLKMTSGKQNINQTYHELIIQKNV